ncbi:MAG: 4Fe-4S dicluster domain-containing protein [Desulfobacterales bacterium]
MFKMTSNILKNLLTEKATRLYPFEKPEPYENVRGELVNDVNKCNFCGICAAKCPSACITVDKKTGTWECALFSCLFCGICVEACPKKAFPRKLNTENRYAKSRLFPFREPSERRKRRLKIRASDFCVLTARKSIYRTGAHA